MRPLRQWIAIERKTKVPSTRVLYISNEDQGESLVGNVIAIGSGIKLKGKMARKLDVSPGEWVLYSSRIDQYRVGDHLIDVIEEGSIIGIFPEGTVL